MDKDIKASIVIRTYNEERYLSQTLTMVFSQSFKDFEVIIVDSESNDSTLEIAQKFPVIIKEIKKEEFTYGRALNIGVEMSKGEFVVFLSGHSIPCDIYWLENLLKSFEDSRISGVCGNQIYHPNAPYTEKIRLKSAFNRPMGLQNLGNFIFSNSNSAIRKEAWRQCLFDPIIERCEDIIWARNQMELGNSIYFQPCAQVYHSHNYTWRQLINKATNDYFYHLRMNNSPTFSRVEKLPSLCVNFINLLCSLKISIVHFLRIRSFNLSDFIDYLRTNFIYRYARYKINRNFICNNKFLDSERSHFIYEK